MIDYISQLKSIDMKTLDLLYEEVQNTETHWVDSFSDYQSGGWQIASLYNATGDETYDVPLESKPIATPLIERMPRMKSFLDLIGLDFMMARLTQSLPDSHLYEHADYGGLDKHKKLRLHMPLHTHPKAVMSLPEVNIYLKKGFLWKLDPKAAIHGVCNSGTEPRIHLMLDCYINSELQSLIDGQWLDADLVTERPEMTPERLAPVMAQAKRLLLEENAREAEHFLLTTFYEYCHPSHSSSYDLILDLYEETTADPERINYWLVRMEEVYGKAHVHRRQMNHTKNGAY